MASTQPAAAGFPEYDLQCTGRHAGGRDPDASKPGRRGPGARIEFADTGIGITEGILHKIFDAFFTTKDSVKGVGLGLSVCYGFIQDHGGDIQVESEPGSGTDIYHHPPDDDPQRRRSDLP